jgi:hypothetical protein
MSGSQKLTQTIVSLLMVAPMIAWGQISLSQASTPNNPAPSAITSASVAAPYLDDSDAARKDLESCHIHQVKSLPGSHLFASEFIETIATDPDPTTGILWALTSDLSSEVPSQDRAMYISKSSDGGVNWSQVARIDSRYFDAGIGEGLRNGLGVVPGGHEFVITTQRGLFQVFPQSNDSATVVIPIPGPRVPHVRPKVSIPKEEGDPVRAGVVLITADGRRMLVGYGYFDLDPQLFSYHKDKDGLWIQDSPLPRLPTDTDLLSMQFDNSRKPHPSSLYVGTGDQAYRLNLHTMKWIRIRGVGPDSAIHGMTMVGGLHLAACWGIYNPAGGDVVKRVTHAKFLLHRAKDETGPNLRAYSIEVDPSNPNREVVTSITGVYSSKDGGKIWKRLSDLPEGEYRTAHFNPDGSVIVSGIAGTFLANPFSSACSLHLRTRNR